jgi:hypothetical protein
VVVGLVGVAVGMGIAAWLAMRWTLRGRRELGLLTVAVAALPAFALALLLVGSPLALAIPAVATLIGFALAFGFDGDDQDQADGDPPWWPTFERELRHYERERNVVGPRRG